MKLELLLKSLLLTGSVVVLLTIPAKGEEVKVVDAKRSSTRTDTGASNQRLPLLSSTQPPAIKEIRQLSEIQLPLTNAQMLVQSPKPGEATQEVVEVTQVKVNPTEKGFEIILQTPKGQQLQVLPNKQGNSYIVDIPNAQLRLPSGNTFRQDKPVSGITAVTVTNLDVNTIRVTVTGEAGVPTVELFDSNEGLIFGFTPVASSTTPQPPQTPQKPEPEKPASQPQPEQPSADSNEPIELLVTGEQDGYFVPEASTATKFDVPLRDVPASVQVIPKQVIEDRQVVRLGELANNVSGVQRQETFGGLSSQGYYIRGFSSGFEALRNGFRDFGFLSPRDVANIERVEFLKGPASVLYGSTQSLGGAVNTVTKKPLPDPFYQAGVTIGSYDFYRPTFDITGPLTENKFALYRLNFAYENANSFRDFNKNESIFITPAITLKLGERTNLTLEYEYQKNDFTFDRGLPPAKVSFDVPISRFLGEPDLNNAEFNSNTFTYVLEHQTRDRNWKFRQGFNLINVDAIAEGVQPDAVDDNGQTVRRRFRRNDDQQENISFQNEISGKFNTGPIRHNILVGFEYANYQLTSDLTRRDIAAINIFNPVYGAKPSPDIRSRSFDEYGADNVAVYIHDLIELTPNIKFLAGGRFDWVDSFRTDLTATKAYDDQTSDSKFSPRLGIVYQPTNSTSLYASWTNSFNPIILSRSRLNEPFKPEEGEQYEVGVKQEFFDKRLSATLAFFDITKQNVLTNDPDPNFSDDYSVQTGEQKSRGVELDIAGEILPGWRVIVTYAYTDAYVSEDNNPDLVNDRLQGIPFNSASLWTTYEFLQGSLQGLGFGFGLVYAGEREATLPNDVKLPSYLRADASVFYRRNNLRLGLNFKNLFDTKYYNSQGFFIVPAEPFTVLGTVAVDF